MSTKDILQSIFQERLAQDRKWGPIHHNPCQWITILAEEVGEASQEALRIELAKRDRLHEYRAELVQVAAVAVSMIEDLDNGRAWVTDNQENS